VNTAPNIPFGLLLTVVPTTWIGLHSGGYTPAGLGSTHVTERYLSLSPVCQRIAESALEG
jgi:hypothetical protein